MIGTMRSPGSAAAGATESLTLPAFREPAGLGVDFFIRASLRPQAPFVHPNLGVPDGSGREITEKISLQIEPGCYFDSKGFVPSGLLADPTLVPTPAQSEPMPP